MCPTLLWRKTASETGSERTSIYGHPQGCIHGSAQRRDASGESLDGVIRSQSSWYGDIRKPFFCNNLATIANTLVKILGTEQSPHCNTLYYKWCSPTPNQVWIPDSCVPKGNHKSSDTIQAALESKGHNSLQGDHSKTKCKRYAGLHHSGPEWDENCPFPSKPRRAES